MPIVSRLAPGGGWLLVLRARFVAWCVCGEREQPLTIALRVDGGDRRDVVHITTICRALVDDRGSIARDLHEMRGLEVDVGPLLRRLARRLDGVGAGHHTATNDGQTVLRHIVAEEVRITRRAPETLLPLE